MPRGTPSPRPNPIPQPQPQPQWAGAAAGAHAITKRATRTLRRSRMPASSARDRTLAHPPGPKQDAYSRRPAACQCPCKGTHRPNPGVRGKPEVGAVMRPFQTWKVSLEGQPPFLDNRQVRRCPMLPKNPYMSPSGKPHPLSDGQPTSILVGSQTGEPIGGLGIIGLRSLAGTSRQKKVVDRYPNRADVHLLCVPYSDERTRFPKIL